MKNAKIIWSICLIGIGLLPGAILLQAQSNLSSIVGTLTDASGAVVPGVTVTVTNKGTNQSKIFVSDDHGNYEVTHLVPGIYSVAGELAGFKHFVAEKVELDVAVVVRVDIHLQIGGISEQGYALDSTRHHM
jgi:hypothetical protein